MEVRDIMRSEPRFCRPGDDLAAAGRTMAEVGAGVLPVVGDAGRVVGVITDRDVCCAAAKLDRKPSEIQVGAVTSGQVHSCQPHEDLRDALATMRRHQVRRLPVVDASGRLQGLLSLDDVVLQARIFEREGFRGPIYSDVVETLQEIVRHATPAVVPAATKGRE